MVCVFICTYLHKCTHTYICKYIHVHIHYLALNIIYFLIHATNWMNLDNISLKEMSVTKKTNTMWLHFYDVVVKFIEAESIIVFARDWREDGMRTYFLIDAEFQFCWVQWVLETADNNSCTTIQVYWKYWAVQLKTAEMANFMLYIFFFNENIFKKHTNMRNCLLSVRSISVL